MGSQKLRVPKKTERFNKGPQGIRISPTRTLHRPLDVRLEVQSNSEQAVKKAFASPCSTKMSEVLGVRGPTPSYLQAEPRRPPSISTTRMLRRVHGEVCVSCSLSFVCLLGDREYDVDPSMCFLIGIHWPTCKKPWRTALADDPRLCRWLSFRLCTEALEFEMI